MNAYDRHDEPDQLGTQCEHCDHWVDAQDIRIVQSEPWCGECTKGLCDECGELTRDCDGCEPTYEPENYEPEWLAAE